MHRVLSFQMARGFGESNEFVTKRMCFSFIFFIGFLALLGGFLLGRLSAERTVKLHEDRKRLELASNALEDTAGVQMQHLLLEELQGTSFDRFPHTRTPGNEGGLDFIEPELLQNILSSYDLFHTISLKESSIIATLYGSSELGRGVVVSVNGDGTKLALEVARILGKFRRDQRWTSRRTLIFCFFHQPPDPCRDNLDENSRAAIVAYLAIHGKAIQKNGCFLASGSDLVRSAVLEAAKAVEASISSYHSEDCRIFQECKSRDYTASLISLPRLHLDIPHASLSFVATTDNSSTVAELSAYQRTLTEIVGFSVFRFLDSEILPWNLNDFELNIKTAFKPINSSQFADITEPIVSTVEELTSRVQSLREKISSLDITKPTDVRRTNNLLRDLDQALLCPDENMRSQTDLVLIPKLSTESPVVIATFLYNLQKCYNNAIQVLQEG